MGVNIKYTVIINKICYVIKHNYEIWIGLGAGGFFVPDPNLSRILCCPENPVFSSRSRSGLRFSIFRFFFLWPLIVGNWFIHEKDITGRGKGPVFVPTRRREAAWKFPKRGHYSSLLLSVYYLQVPFTAYFSSSQSHSFILPTLRASGQVGWSKVWAKNSNLGRIYPKVSCSWDIYCICCSFCCFPTWGEENQTMGSVANQDSAIKQFQSLMEEGQLLKTHL